MSDSKNECLFLSSVLAGWTGKDVITHETVVKRGVCICSSVSAENSQILFLCGHCS